MLRVFDNIDGGKKSIHNIDLLRAMRWAVEEWRRCLADVMHNSFYHCFLEAGEVGSDIQKEVEAETKENIQRNTHKHGVAVPKVRLLDILKPEEEDNVLEKVNYDAIVREVAGIQEHEKKEEEGQFSAAVEEVHTVKQQLQSLAAARTVLEQHAPLGVDCR